MAAGIPRSGPTKSIAGSLASANRDGNTSVSLREIGGVNATRPVTPAFIPA